LAAKIGNCEYPGEYPVVTLADLDISYLSRDRASDSEDDMEADAATIRKEEARAARQAREDDRREEAEERRRAEEKRRRKERERR
jgi:hypothetical protein